MLYKLTRIQKGKHSNNVPMHRHQNLLCRSYFSVKSPSERFSKLNHLLIGSDSTLVKGELFDSLQKDPLPQYLLTWVLIVQELACCVWKRDKVFNPQNPETLSSSKSLPVGICLRANISWQRFLPLGTSIGTFCQYELIGTWCKNVETLLKAASERVTRCWAVPLLGRWSLGDAALADGISTKSWPWQRLGFAKKQRQRQR